MNDIIPFALGIKAEGDTFTDRKEETEILCGNFAHGVNTIIISPRRIGKTSLVDKVVGLTESENLRIVRMDIFACRSVRDFEDVFVTAVIKSTATRFEEWIANAKSFLAHLVPKVSLSPDPMNEFSVSIDYDSIPDSLDEVLALPERIAEKNGYRIVVCIDEFQQIGEMSDSLTFQKKLRAVWQHQKLVSYCLYGSKKHMMESIFMNPSYPFYRFGELMYLKRISREDWIPFIRRRFEATGKQISEELAGMICDHTECYSAYVQQLAWFVWHSTKSNATEECVEYGVKRLLDANESLYIQMTESLTELQMNFLKALSDGITTGFSQQEVLRKYRLGTSANINRLKKSLKERDLVETTTTNHIDMCDPVLKLWLKRRVWGISRCLMSLP